MIKGQLLSTTSKNMAFRATIHYCARLTMDIIENTNNWEEIFEKYSIHEIRSLNVQLGALADSKQQELRQVVGNRYKDMLKTADMIISMNDLVTQEDAALSDLVTKESHTSWYNHEKQFLKFNKFIIPSNTTFIDSLNPKDAFTNVIHKPLAGSESNTREKYLKEKSILKLTEDTLSFVKRFLNHQNLYILDDSQPHNFLRVARGLRLAELLLNEINSSEVDTPVYGSVLSDSNKIAQFRLQLKELKESFEKILNKLFLNGEANDILQPSSYLTLFISYAYFKHFNPNQVLETLLESRLNFIGQKFDEFLSNKDMDRAKLVTFFPETLSLLSSTYSLAQKSFFKNHIPIIITKQHSVYSLLDTPELYDDVELNLSKYKKWLPDSVKNERAFPEACTENIISTSRNSSKITQYLKSKLTKFSDSVIKVLNERVPQLISFVDDLELLVALYKNVLEVARDYSSIRNLKGQIPSSDDAVSFYSTIFVENWTAKFNTLIESRINDLLNQENALRAIHGNIFTPQAVTNISAEASLSEMHDTIFSTEFVSSLSQTRGYSNATNLFTMLEDFSTGSVGSISPVAHEYKIWLDRISAIKEHVEEFGKTKALLSLTYGISEDTSTEDIDEDDYDDGLADEWRATEKVNIDKIYKLFNAQIQKTLEEVYSDMIREVGDLFKKNQQDGNSTDDQIEGAVVLIRAILLFEWYFESMNENSGILSHNQALSVAALKSTPVVKKEDKRAQELVDKIFKYLANLLAERLPNVDSSYYQFADIDLWTSTAQRNSSDSSDEKKSADIWPDVPSLAILKYLTNLVEKLLKNLGHDNLLWTNDDGLLAIQQAIGSKIVQFLEDNYQKLLAQHYSSDVQKVNEVEESAVSDDTKDEDKGESEKYHEENDKEINDGDKKEEEKEEKEEKEKEEQTETSNAKPSVENSLDISGTVYPILQLYADFQYVSKLLGIPESASLSLPTLNVKSNKNSNVSNDSELETHLQKVMKNHSQDIKDSMTETVTKTRFVYLPLAV